MSEIEWDVYKIIMNIYVLGFLLTLILGLLTNTGIKRDINGYDLVGYKKNRIIVISFFVIFWGSLLCFRDLSVGTDTKNYAYICHRISNLPWSDLLKDWQFLKFPLYMLFNRCASIISDDVHWFVFINSLIYILGVSLFLYQNSRNLAMTILYFLLFHFYFWAMNINRESIAIMLIMWCYHYANRGNIKKSMIFLVCAVLVHNTALFGVPILFVCLYVKANKEFKTTAFIGGILCVIAKIAAVLFVKIFPIYADYFSTESAFSISNDTSNGNRIYVALFVLFIMFVYYLWRNRNSLNPIRDVVFWRILSLSTVGIELMILQNKNEIFARLELYYTYFLALLLPEIIERFIKRDSRKFFYCLTFLILFIPFYVKLDGYLPYEIGIFK